MMKKVISITVAAIMMVAMSLAFAGCGSEPANLQEYMESNSDLQEELAESVEGLEDDSMAVKVYYEGNCMAISLKYKDTYTAEQIEIMKPSFEGFSDYFQSLADELIVEIEKETELTGVSVKIEVINGDGEEIWAEEYTKAKTKAK